VFQKTAFLLVVVLTGLSLPCFGQSAEREKVEEGRYVLLKKGGRVSATGRSWTLWRLPENRYELEDRFEDLESIDQMGATMAQDSKLGKKLQNQVFPAAEMFVQYEAGRQATRLTVRGRYITRKQTMDLLTCIREAAAAHCSRPEGKVNISFKEPRELFYATPVPELLQPWISAFMEKPQGGGPWKVVILTLSYPVIPTTGPANLTSVELGMEKLALEKADLTVSAQGVETLTIGDRQFHARKFLLTVKAETGVATEFTVWADAKGRVLAMKAPGQTDEIMALVQYKSYAVP